MRILLVSDVHLDTPFAWAKLDVAQRRRQALRDALARSIQLAIDQHVDIICCGGDLFEHDRVSPDTGQFLRVLFERAHPIPIFIARATTIGLAGKACIGELVGPRTSTSSVIAGLLPRRSPTV